MIRKILLLVSLVMLGACSLSCSDRFGRANLHVLDTAQSVYKSYSLGNVTDSKLAEYKMQIENAYRSVGEGSELCESSEDSALESFQSAENILLAIDTELAMKKVAEQSEIKGK